MYVNGEWRWRVYGQKRITRVMRAIGKLKNRKAEGTVSPFMPRICKLAWKELEGARRSDKGYCNSSLQERGRENLMWVV